jgi:hypothetical protein
MLLEMQNTEQTVKELKSLLTTEQVAKFFILSDKVRPLPITKFLTIFACF